MVHCTVLPLKLAVKHTSKCSFVPCGDFPSVQWELEELEAVLELPEICILPMEAWGPGTNGKARSMLGAWPLRPTSGGQGYSVH